MKTRIFIILIFIPCIAFAQEKEWLLKKDSIFTSVSSRHFNLFSVEGYLSSNTRQEILKRRERAYKEISVFFDTDTDITINIFLFQDEQSKYNLTGHKGYGWGFDNNIVEVHNDSIKVDPYHELVHVLGYTLNKPPVLFDEGTAVYLSQVYGDNAFSKLIGYPAKSINEILLMMAEKEEMIDISVLLSYDEIGKSNNPVLAYCQFASFVEFLIGQYGRKKFLELFKTLSISDIDENERLFFQVYHKNIKTIESKWKSQVGI